MNLFLDLLDLHLYLGDLSLGLSVLSLGFVESFPLEFYLNLLHLLLHSFLLRSLLVHGIQLLEDVVTLRRVAQFDDCTKNEIVVRAIRRYIAQETSQLCLLELTGNDAQRTLDCELIVGGVPIWCELHVPVHALADEWVQELSLDVPHRTPGALQGRTLDHRDTRSCLVAPVDVQRSIRLHSTSTDLNQTLHFRGLVEGIGIEVPQSDGL